MDIGTVGIYMCLFLGLYFEVLLLLLFLEKRPAAHTTSLPKKYPSVTMIVPCWNEEKTIARTLDSLLAMEYPKDKLSILVVDDGSTDTTSEIAKQYASAHAQIEYVYKENGGKYTALNLGIARSKSDLVGCLDADSFVAKDGLIEMAKALEAHPEAMALTPSMKVHHPKNVLELMQAVEYTFGIFYKKMFDHMAAINVLPGPFSMYRRSVFDIIGPFRHAHNTEDMEIAFRMHAHHLSIINAHHAVVYTTVPRTVRTLVKQRRRWSQGFLQNSKDYQYMFFNPRFGNFGVLVLPFGMAAFFAGLYSALYVAYKLLHWTITSSINLWVTHVPLRVPHVVDNNWLYLNTSSLMFIMLITICCTVVAIALGQRIARTKLGFKSFVSYFAFFGFIAPIWLAQAAWGAARSRESSWR